MRDQLSDLVEREPEHLRLLNEREPINDRNVINAIAASGSSRAIKKPTLLVETKRLNADTAELGDIADLVCSGSCSLR